MHNFRRAYAELADERLVESSGLIATRGMSLTISIALDASRKVTGSSIDSEPNGSDLGTIAEGMFDANTVDLIINVIFPSGLTPTFTF